ncbi:MAG TPA: hypothetical protein PK867_31215, partial [Pirellulales bacterium]|nr:hypothetical protein [Pirellulales bacterium]
TKIEERATLTSQFGELAWGNGQDRISKLAATEEQFLSLLKEALQSGFIMSTIQSLIAKSNEAKQPAHDETDEE